MSFGLYKMVERELPEKWKKEEKAIKAIQMAFDLDEKIQYIIRREALDMEINPSERMRQILGLSSNKTPQRPRLSISLKPDDFDILADRYQVDVTDKRAIKQQVSLELQKYAKGINFKKNK